MESCVDICFCCAPEDDDLRDKLEQQLKLYERQGKIRLWHSTNISTGMEVEDEIKKHLLSADIIILLVSASFFSYRWYEYISNVAMKRYKDKGDVHIIPVVLRKVSSWHDAPFGKLKALPHNGKPVRNWRPLDDGLSDVADGIRSVFGELIEVEKPTLSISTNEIAVSQPLSQPLEEEEIPSLSGNDRQDFVLVGTSLAHSAPVTCVIFTPDGDNYMSDSTDRTIIIWNTHNRRKQDEIKGHSDPIYSMALSRDMHTLVSAGDEDTIKVWGVNTRNFHKTHIRQILVGHSGPVACVVLSPDGKTLFSASDDSTISIWDLLTGRVHQTLKEHSNAVCCIALSSDGSMLVSGSVDKTVGLWSSGGQFQKLVGHSGPIRSVAVSSDNRTLASGSDDSTVRLWDLQTGQCKILAGHSGPIYGVDFSPDGSILASGSADKTIKVWDTSTARLFRTIVGHSDEVLCVAFHPSKRLIASGSSDKTVKIWELSNAHNPRVPSPSGSASIVGMSAPSLISPPLQPISRQQHQKRLRDGAISGSRLGAIIGPIVGIILGAGLTGANITGKEWWIGVGVAALGGLGIGVIGGALGVGLGFLFGYMGHGRRILVGILAGALLGLIIGIAGTSFVLHINFQTNSDSYNCTIGCLVSFGVVIGALIGGAVWQEAGDEPIWGYFIGGCVGLFVGWVIGSGTLGIITILNQGWSLTVFPSSIAGGVIGLLCNVLVSLAMRNFSSEEVNPWSFGATGAIISIVGGSVLGCAIGLGHQSGQMAFIGAVIGLAVGSLGVSILGGILGLIRAHLFQ